jgi:hypothetical protein
MKNEYISPEINITEFAVADVITTSGPEPTDPTIVDGTSQVDNSAAGTNGWSEMF